MNNLTKDSIEAVSTSRLTQILSIVPKVKPEIKSNDKTPSWDGNIFLYNNNQKKKEQLLGILSIQVKGHAGNCKKKESVKISDLNNYLNNGGVFYFVVFIDKKDHNKCYIFYNALTPVKIKYYLDKNASNKKVLSIDLDEFPSGNTEIYDLFLNFSNDSRKQHSFVNHIIDLKNIKDNNLLNFEISASTTKKFPKGTPLLEIQKEIFIGKETYAYVVSNDNIPIPTNSFGKITEITQSKNVKIKIGEYEVDAIFINSTSKVCTIKILDSIEIIQDFKNPVSINIKPSNSLRKSTKAFAIFIELTKNPEIIINDKVLKLGISVDINSEDIIKVTEGYEYLKSITFLLDSLYIKEDLNLSTLTENDYYCINYLLEHFIPNLDSYASLIEEGGKVEFVNIHIQELLIKLGRITNPHNIHIFDIINTKYGFKRTHDNGEEEDITAYSGFPLDILKKISNINFDIILKRYEDLLSNGNYRTDTIIIDVVNMISAYDSNNNIEWLDTAERINNLIISDYAKFNKDILNINSLQITKRRRELNESEKDLLLEIIENNKENLLFKFCAYLLLDYKPYYKKTFELLEEKDKTIVRGWPIFAFYKP